MLACNLHPQDDLVRWRAVVTVALIASDGARASPQSARLNDSRSHVAWTGHCSGQVEPAYGVAGVSSRLRPLTTAEVVGRLVPMVLWLSAHESGRRSQCLGQGSSVHDGQADLHLPHQAALVGVQQPYPTNHRPCVAKATAH